jgi:glutathionylspermidine synthase
MAQDWRKERIAKNEAQFRTINEQLEAGLRQVRHAPELQEFVCECGNRTCEQLVALSFEEFEAVRGDSRRFAVVPGHGLPEAERVVESNDRYDVVEKLGKGIELADATDQRTPDDRGRRSADPTP